MPTGNTDNMGKLFPAVRDKLSHFLLLLLPSRQFCNDQCTRTPAFAEATAVKARICTQLKSCTVTGFWLRDNLYRDLPAGGAKVPGHNQCCFLSYCARSFKPNSNFSSYCLLIISFLIH